MFRLHHLEDIYKVKFINDLQVKKYMKQIYR